MNNQNTSVHNVILFKYQSQMSKINIYILELTNEKIYVGKTNSLSLTIADHLSHKGLQWTCENKPVKILEIIDNCDEFDVDKYTKKYMSKYGINKVRGGSYTDVVLDDATLFVLNKEIQTVQKQEAKDDIGTEIQKRLNQGVYKRKYQHDEILKIWYPMENTLKIQEVMMFYGNLNEIIHSKYLSSCVKENYILYLKTLILNEKEIYQQTKQEISSRNSLYRREISKSQLECLQLIKKITDINIIYLNLLNKIAQENDNHTKILNEVIIDWIIDIYNAIDSVDETAIREIPTANNSKQGMFFNEINKRLDNLQKFNLDLKTNGRKGK